MPSAPRRMLKVFIGLVRFQGVTKTSIAMFLVFLWADAISFVLPSGNSSRTVLLWARPSPLYATARNHFVLPAGYAGFFGGVLSVFCCLLQQAARHNELFLKCSRPPPSVLGPKLRIGIACGIQLAGAPHSPLPPPRTKLGSSSLAEAAKGLQTSQLLLFKGTCLMRERPRSARPCWILAFQLRTSLESFSPAVR